MNSRSIGRHVPKQNCFKTNWDHEESSTVGRPDEDSFHLTNPRQQFHFMYLLSYFKNSLGFFFDVSTL